MTTLGDLKINCYRLIDPNDTQVYPEQIEEVYEKDEAYSFYFLNMLNSINTAITRIVQACILPLKIAEINASNIYSETLQIEQGELIQTKQRVKIDLKEYAGDIYKLKKIDFVDNYGNSEKLNHRLIGNILDTENKKCGTYEVYYYPRINALEWYFNQDKYSSINDIDLNEIGIDDNIISIIPYFVKADLLEHDKPTEAVLARNTFEQYLSSFEMEDVEIHSPYKSWWGGSL